MTADSTARDLVRIRTVADLDDLELVEATYGRHRFRPHYHETYLVGVTEAGAELFEARGGRHISAPLSLRFHNPGEVHTGAPLPGKTWTYRCVYPSVALLEDVARDLGHGRAGAPWFPEMVVMDAPLALALLHVCASGSSRPGVQDLATSVGLVGVLGRILERHARDRPTMPSPRRDPRTILRAQEYIASRSTESIGLGELSEAIGLSRFHLVRAFVAQVGLTPSAFQAQIRVGRAKALLRAGHPVGHVAETCGFHDRSHLARTFRSFVGTTPDAYRRSVARWRGRSDEPDYGSRSRRSSTSRST